MQEHAPQPRPAPTFRRERRRSPDMPQTIDALVQAGVDLIFGSRVPPAEAAVRLVRSPDQLDRDDTLIALRRAFAVWIEEELDRRQRLPRFNLAAESASNLAAVRPDDLQRLNDAGQAAQSKLDAFYAVRTGEMKPLNQFSAEDHGYRAEYAAAQAKTWGQWVAFHQAAATLLARRGVAVIAALPAPDQATLEGLIP